MESYYHEIFPMPNMNSQNILYLFPTNPEEVENIIHKLKHKTSFGHDHISPKLLKQISLGLLLPCVHIINLSLSSGVVPVALKKAKVIPIYKNSGSKEVMKNY